MTEQLVRGHFLAQGAKFLRAHYPPETHERLLGGLPKPLRALLLDVQPAQWYPRAHHVDMLNAIVSVHRDDSAAFRSLTEYGLMIAAEACKGPLAPLMRLLTPKLLARKLPNLWSNDHQRDGVLEVDLARVDDGLLDLRLAELQAYPHVGVMALGWVSGLVSRLGAREVTMKQNGWSLGRAAPTQLTCEVRWS